MNYRHAYHAGNFADVIKHMILVYTLDYLCKKPAPFYVLDTHGGKGLYSLISSEALRTQEAAEGILSFQWEDPLPSVAHLYYETLKPYLSQSLYPGSPEIIKSYLRVQDRAHVVELHPEDVCVLKEILEGEKAIQVFHQNGYQALKAFLPPKERRGVVIIDPAFEKPQEFLLLEKGVHQALKRFAHGTYIIWYPLKEKEAAKKFYDSFTSHTKSLLITYEKASTKNLTSAGLLVINPPFGLPEALQEASNWLAHNGIKLSIIRYNM